MNQQQRGSNMQGMQGQQQHPNQMGMNPMQQQQPMLSQHQPLTANSVGPLVVQPQPATSLPLIVSSAATGAPLGVMAGTAAPTITTTVDVLQQQQQQQAAANLAAQAAAAAAATAVSQTQQAQQLQQQQQTAAAAQAALLNSGLLNAPATAAALGIPASATSAPGGLDLNNLNPQQQQLLQQMQLQQQQQQHLKKLRQRMPHVSGAEMRTLQLQIADLQRQQQLQNLQTLRLAQRQEKQAFKYLNQAIKNRPSRTYQTLYNNKGKTGSPLLLRKDNAHIPSAALLGGSSLASSVVSSYGPTSATREHEKRILETILPPDLRHLVHG